MSVTRWWSHVLPDFWGKKLKPRSRKMDLAKFLEKFGLKLESRKPSKIVLSHGGRKLVYPISGGILQIKVTIKKNVITLYVDDKTFNYEFQSDEKDGDTIFFVKLPKLAHEPRTKVKKPQIKQKQPSNAPVGAAPEKEEDPYEEIPEDAYL